MRIFALMNFRKVEIKQSSSEQGFMFNEEGFTLLEVLVTISLIAIISAIVIPDIGQIFRESLEAYARKSSNLFREARDHALLTSRVVRVRFDLDEQKYWVEEADGYFLLPTKKSLEERERKLERLSEEEKSEFSDPFRMVDSITRRKTPVPDGIRVSGMLTPRSAELLEEGIGEFYYFPHGAAENAIIHIENIEGEKRSLVVQPTTGKTKVEVGFYFPAEDRR